VSRCAWWRQPIEKAAALTRPPQRKARAVSSQAERGSLRRVERTGAGAAVNGARSFRTGHRAWVVESDAICERFAVDWRAPALEWAR
jgi:hypothetical protein